MTLRCLVSGAAAGLGVNLFIHTLLWIAGLAWALRSACLGRLRIWGTGLGWPLVVYFLVVGASPLFAAHTLPAFARASELWSALLLYLLLANLPGEGGDGAPDRRRIATVVVALVTGAALVNALYGMYQVGFGYDAWRQAVARGEAEAPVDPAERQEFESRLWTTEAFGMFGLSNSLAGFLLLVLPAALSFAWGAWRKGERGSAAAWTAAGAALLTGLVLTRSKGGCLAAAGGMASLGLLRAWSRSARSRRIIAAGAAVVVFGVVGLGSAGVLDASRVRSLSRSASVRLDYWAAALKIVDESPVLGVGLDNFGDAYTRHKSAGAQETQRAHNDYLDAWAEMGVVGFGAFAALWAVFLMRVLGRAARAADGTRAPPEAARGLDRRSRWALLAGGAAAFALAVGLRGMFVEGAGAAVAGALCFAAWAGWVAWVGRRGIEPSAAALPLAAGVVGFLLHAAIDIDWSAPAIAQGVLALLAAWARASEAEHAEPSVVVPLAAFGKTLAPLPFAVGVLVLVGFLVPRAMRADDALSGAEADMAEAASLYAGERRKGGSSSGALAEEAAGAIRGRLRSAEERLAEGMAANPWDARLYDAAASAAERWLVMGVAGGAEAEARFERAREMRERAAALDPRNAGLRALRGGLWEGRALRLEALQKAEDRPDRDRLRWEAGDAWKKALAAYAEAVERYPARALYRCLLAEVLDRVGRAEEARREYAKALALHGEVVRAGGVDRLRLSEPQRKEIAARLEALSTPAPPSAPPR